MTWTREYKAEYARQYRKQNTERINSLRRTGNAEKRKFLLNLFDNTCRLCGKIIQEDEKYTIHHLTYDEDFKKFNKKIAPFQNLAYVANHKENFILLHRYCHNALHRIMDIPISNIIEVKQLCQKH